MLDATCHIFESICHQGNSKLMPVCRFHTFTEDTAQIFNLFCTQIGLCTHKSSKEARYPIC